EGCSLGYSEIFSGAVHVYTGSAFLDGFAMHSGVTPFMEIDGGFVQGVLTVAMHLAINDMPFGLTNPGTGVQLFGTAQLFTRGVEWVADVLGVPVGGVVPL